MGHFLRGLAGDGFLLLILLAFGLFASIKRWPEWFRRVRSASWPTVSGIIKSGNVSTIRSTSRYGDRGIENATATLAYSYRLGDDYFAGYYTKTFNDEQRAWSYVDGLKGQPVIVSYHSRKPDVSVLRRPPTIVIQP